jgi:hypothetical protein
MGEIRILALKILQLVLIGSLLPVIGLLILAAFNERIRRILLWIMAPLAALAVVSYFIFAPIPAGEIENLADVLAAYKTGLLAGLPFLVGLALAGGLAYFGGPPAARALHENQRQRARRRYLNALVEWAERQLSRSIAPGGREPGELPAFLWMSGAAGVGKSLLLRRELLGKARQALSDETHPLPVLIDLDRLSSDETVPLSLEALQPASLPASAALLENETSARRVSLLVDSSILSFSPALSAETERERRLEQMVSIIEAIDPAQLVVSLPPGIQPPALEKLAPDRLVIEPLTGAEIRQAVNGLAGEQAGALLQGLEAANSSWGGLAVRWFILEKLARFFTNRQRLPGDARELFRETVYPKLAAEQVEAGLARLAGTLLKESRSSLPLERAAKMLLPLTARELEQTGLLRASPEGQRVGFAHPLYLAYFSALAWRDSQTALLTIASGSGSDPLLGDALVFFNNILPDPAGLAAVIEGLAGQDDPKAQLLAAHCLLAAPVGKRPAALVERLAARLLQGFTGNIEGTRLAWLLLNCLDADGRLRVWEAALPVLDRAALKQALADMDSRSPDDARAVVWQGQEDVSRLVGQALAENWPREALSLYKEIYAGGTPERRRLAVELVGSLPREAAGDYLRELLEREREPECRVVILNSLAQAGVPAVFILLEIIADQAEADAVRTQAAKLLCTSNLEELQTDRAAREIVRISRMPAPEQVQCRLGELLDRLRKTRPDSPASGVVERWEGMINPYRPGRPLTERDLFFGRDKLMHTLRSAVESGTHALLIGERQAGKSTVLHQLHLALVQEAAQGVAVRGAYVDLGGLQPHEFYETILRVTIEQINDPRLAAEAQVPRPYTEKHFERDLGELLVYLEDSLGSGARLALLLDEADVFLDYPQPVHASLRRILTGPAAGRLTVILAGRALLSGLRQPEPPFYSGFPTYQLEPFNREDALRLMTLPVAGTFQWEPDALELVQQATHGRPAEIQAVCLRLVNELLATGARLVTAGQVRTTLAETDLARAELLAQAGRLLDGMLDWVYDHPGAPQSEMQAQIKHTWEALGREMVQSIHKIKKI